MSTVRLYAITTRGRQKLPYITVDNDQSTHGPRVTKIVREVRTEHFV